MVLWIHTQNNTCLRAGCGIDELSDNHFQVLGAVTEHIAAHTTQTLAYGWYSVTVPKFDIYYHHNNTPTVALSVIMSQQNIASS